MTETQKALDHIVLVAQELEPLRWRYDAMGFTLTPPSLHPFGTGNSLAQLQGSFIELLAVVEPEKLVPHGETTFSFGVHNQRFLEKREGLSMAVLTSDDAAGDNAAWAARGLRTWEPLSFARQATQPDGSQAEVSFTVAFALDPAMPEAGFFVCQQHRPENFWQPNYQLHANTAKALVCVTLVADDPAAHAGFFEKMVGAVQETVGGLEIPLAGGRLEVLRPDALDGRFATAKPIPSAEGPAFVAASVAVDDLAATQHCIETGGIPFTTRDGALEIAPEDGFGMLLEFVSEQ